MWALKQRGYNCRIEYLSGKENTCADLLFRIPKRLEQESMVEEPELDEITKNEGRGEQGCIKIRLLETNKGIISCRDKELARTQTVTMKIDTETEALCVLNAH